MKVDASMSLSELLAVAIKSEIESYDMYRRLIEKIGDFVLREKLKFLALEEKKHWELLEKVFRKEFPNTELHLPSQTMVPVPDLAPEEGMPLSTVLSKVMEAEEEAREFYSSLIPLFGKKKVKQALRYLSETEQSHHSQIKREYEMALKLET